MVIDRYVLRLWLAPFLSSLVIVLSVLMLGRALKVLGLVAEKGVDWGFMGLLLWSAMPYFLILTVPIAFFFAGQSVIVKLGQESELDALRASGISSIRVIRSLLAIAVAIWLFLTWATLEWMPVSQKNFQGLVYALQQSKGVPGFDAGRFNRELDNLTIYVDGENPDGSYRGFLMEDARSSIPVIFMAEQARIERSGSNVVISLNKGARLEGAGAEQRTLVFDEYTVSIDVGQLGIVTVPKWRSRIHEMSLKELLAEKQRHDSAAVRTELSKRLLLPTTVLILFAFLLPLSLSPKRSGKAGAYGLGIVLLLAVYNIQVILQQQALAGHVGVWLMWAIQLAMLATGIELTRRSVADRLPGLLVAVGEWRYQIHERLLHWLAERK